MHPRPISILIISAFTSLKSSLFPWEEEANLIPTPQPAWLERRPKHWKKMKKISHIFPTMLWQTFWHDYPSKPYSTAGLFARHGFIFSRTPVSHNCTTRVNSNWTILQPKVKDHHLYAVHLCNSSSVIHSSARVRFATKTHLGFGYYVKHHLVDSCNGLILVGEVHQYTYHVSVKLDHYLCVIQ